MRTRDRSLLLRGAKLKEAETWLADQTGRKPAVTSTQAQLILASRRATSQRQRGVEGGRRARPDIDVLGAPQCDTNDLRSRVDEDQIDEAVAIGA